MDFIDIMLLLRDLQNNRKRVIAMSMKEVIRQKRKELDYTQEQIAEQLGVSIPAVSKWESGATYPDVELIPVLARVLKTDVNTLLCFQQELSDLEIGKFVTRISETALTEGMKAAFLMAEQKIQEYPTDVKLIHTLAMTLQGTMMMAEVSEQEKSDFDAKIQKMYERVGSSGKSKYADQSNYMLAARAIQEKRYDRAQELIDKLPEYNALDAKLLQANLWAQTGRTQEAEKVYASKILSHLSQLQIPLGRLIEEAAKSGDSENASRLVRCGQALVEAFGLWKYNAYVFAFEQAMAEENVGETVRILDEILNAMLIPWDISQCPVYRYLGNDKQEVSLGEKMYVNILTELEKSEQYDFLRNDEGFRQLLLKHDGLQEPREKGDRHRRRNLK